MDFLTNNPIFDLTRRASRRTMKPRKPKPSTIIHPPAIKPTLDTSSGIIAFRYSDSATPSASTTPTSAKSDSSFDNSSRSSSSDGDNHNPTTSSRPNIPQRSASRRTISKLSTGNANGARPVTPPRSIAETLAGAAPPPPIPPKSPYRASRFMVQLQNEIAESPGELGTVREAGGEDVDGYGFPSVQVQRSFYFEEGEGEDYDDGEGSERRSSTRTV